MAYGMGYDRFNLRRVNIGHIDTLIDESSASKKGRAIAKSKAKRALFVLSDINIAVANILKQEAISAHAHCLLPKDAVFNTSRVSKALLFGSYEELAILASKLRRQDFSLGLLADMIEEHLRLNIECFDIDSAQGGCAMTSETQSKIDSTPSGVKSELDLAEAQSKVDSMSSEAQSKMDLAEAQSKIHSTPNEAMQNIMLSEIESYPIISPARPYPPQIMTVINLTPDSFYEGSCYDARAAMDEIERLLAKGASIIDIGAASSRPGASIISPSEEIERLAPIASYIEEIKAQRGDITTRFSIDTYNKEVAAFALLRGFDIINDVGGMDKEMQEIAASYKASVVLMHTQGTPATMASLSQYDDVVGSVDLFFATKIAELKRSGVYDIILDIGFGFAKTMEQNIALLHALPHFARFGLPLLVGASMKRSVGLITRRDVKDRLAGTLALHMKALEFGANILRVHDFDAHRDMLRMLEALR